MNVNSSDFQHNNIIYIANTKEQFVGAHGLYITDHNLKETCIYLAVRHSIFATWVNDRDHFLYPKDRWQTDREFQNNCLAFTLFHTQNRITSREGTNHWIPFTEQEVNAHGLFESHFMTDFIAGRCATGAGTKYEVLSTTQGEEKKNVKK